MQTKKKKYGPTRKSIKVSSNINIVLNKHKRTTSKQQQPASRIPQIIIQQPQQPQNYFSGLDEKINTLISQVKIGQTQQATQSIGQNQQQQQQTHAGIETQTDEVKETVEKASSTRGRGRPRKMLSDSEAESIESVPRRSNRIRAKK